jgi:hypothetical protein
MVNTAKALAYMAKQKRPNAAEASRKFGINERTLQRHWKGDCLPRDVHERDFNGLLTKSEEDKLIEWIEAMTNRSLPPTPFMIRKWVEGYLGREIGDHWVSRFLSRRKEDLVSKYLPGLDACRVVADMNKACYEIWYGNVSKQG